MNIDFPEIVNGCYVEYYDACATKNVVVEGRKLRYGRVTKFSGDGMVHVQKFW
jgi:hypothetical protein